MMKHYKKRQAKKGQLEAMFTWIVALIVIFVIYLFVMIWIKPWQAVDNALTPKIDASYSGTNGKCADDIPPIARRNQMLVPLIMMIGVLVMAILASLRKDPNYPNQ